MSKENLTIYTIGYGNRPPEVFASLLKQYSIGVLVDVRTNPYSQFQPGYNSGNISHFLNQHHIEYLYKGDKLGGKPKDARFYVDGKLDRQMVKNSAEFSAGICELISLAGSSKGNVCIMCCELKPAHCHRNRMVGAKLAENGVSVLHINEKGALLPHGQTVVELKLF
jgi:uncharacterized protein (DUF488 family)